MKGDIALAGFVLTHEEWQSLDALSRAQLLAAAFQRDAPWIVAPLAGMLSESVPDENA
jgi:hypothetical protein